MLRQFRFKRHKDETWVDDHTRTCNTARKIWIQMDLASLYEVTAESMWRVMGWTCDERSNAVIDFFKKNLLMDKYEIPANRNDGK